MRRVRPPLARAGGHCRYLRLRGFRYGCTGRKSGQRNGPPGIRELGDRLPQPLKTRAGYRGRTIGKRLHLRCPRWPTVEKVGKRTAQRVCQPGPLSAVTPAKRQPLVGRVLCKPDRSPERQKGSFSRRGTSYNASRFYAPRASTHSQSVGSQSPQTFGIPDPAHSHASIVDSESLSVRAEK